MGILDKLSKYKDDDWVEVYAWNLRGDGFLLGDLGHEESGKIIPTKSVPLKLKFKAKLLRDSVNGGTGDHVRFFRNQDLHRKSLIQMKINTGVLHCGGPTDMFADDLGVHIVYDYTPVVGNIQYSRRSIGFIDPRHMVKNQVFEASARKVFEIHGVPKALWGE